MKTLLSIFQIVLSIALSTLIFLQSRDDNERGNIMSSVNFQKRGWEKVIFYITIIVMLLFVISSIIQATI